MGQFIYLFTAVCSMWNTDTQHLYLTFFWNSPVSNSLMHKHILVPCALLKGAGMSSKWHAFFTTVSPLWGWKPWKHCKGEELGPCRCWLILSYYIEKLGLPCRVWMPPSSLLHPGEGVPSPSSGGDKVWNWERINHYSTPSLNLGCPSAINSNI